MQDNQDYAHYRAIYKDPATNKVTWVDQQELKAEGKGYEDLDRSDNLIQFQMLRVSDDSIIFSVPFREGQGNQLIWRRRIQNHSDGSSVTFYLVGKKGAFVACLMPDFSIMLDNNYNEDNAVLSSVTPVRGEEGYIENED